jgi:RNA polymerase sigma factor (sigma-70 family)
MRAEVSAAFTEEPERGLRVPARLLRLASDEKLVERARGGSEAAFEAIFDRHHRGILAFCRHMLGSVDEAEDAVQHTFIAAYRELARAVDRPLQLRPWLYTIARNRCITVLRGRRREAAGAVVEPSTEHLAAEVDRRSDLRDLLRDVAGLPEEQRAALVLSELGDMGHDDIAAVLGCRREKVKALVFQARSSLIASRTARETPCAEIREQIATLRGGSLRRTELRRHLRECAGCREFREHVRTQRRDLAIVLPVAPTVGLKAAVLGGGGAAGAGVALSGATAAKVLVVAALAGGGTVAVEQTRRAEPVPPRHAVRPAPAPAVPAVALTPAVATPRPAAPVSRRAPATSPPAHRKRHSKSAAEVSPPGRAKKAVAKVPPGQAKKTETVVKVPPGQAKRSEPAKVAPGQAKKTETVVKVPLGQAKKSEPPKVPAGHAKRSEPAKVSPGHAEPAAKVPPGQAKKAEG